MLFAIDKECRELRPKEFLDFAEHGKLEQDLEDLIAKHLLGELFERMPLLTFFEQRPMQAEADIYAVNEAGDVVIFELKRSTASQDALDQLFRYTQCASQWGYDDINRKFQNYQKKEPNGLTLVQAHRDVFNLDEPLDEHQFNQRQIMWVIGSAADESLIRGVDYWKSQGLSIDFLPYRLYEIAGQFYFEFFAKPYDTHVNPGSVKGVLFDTCATYYDDSLRWMVEKKRVSAYGDRKEAVYSLAHGDYVFYSHVGHGLVSAARVVGRSVKSDPGSPSGEDELYWDVKPLTRPPTDLNSPEAMSFAQVRKVTGRNFFWARTQKTPYLNREEAEHLLSELRNLLGEAGAETGK